MSDQLDLRNPTPDSPGVGLRKDHYKNIIQERPKFGFLEVHPENYFGFGPEVKLLEVAAQYYPISLHAVGLSLGSAQRVSINHLTLLKKLVDKINPVFVSDHASWSMSGNAHLNDLLPLPYTKESLNMLCDNVKLTQDYLGRQILVENPSTYIQFKGEYKEHEFMNMVSQKTGARLLLDVNNIYVSSKNHNFCPYEYIDSIEKSSIGEIHLAGHSVEKIDDVEILIDTHDNLVVDVVWDLYDYTISKNGQIPTLIEWDKNLPEFSILQNEAEQARVILQKYSHKNAA